ncbi:MAG: ester cyclase [Chloroflexota bacterium]
MTEKSSKPTSNGPGKLVATEPPPRINLQDKIDIQRMKDANGNRLHSMNGFDPKFTDIVDYIIRITHEIWEEKAIGALYEYYAGNIQLHTSTETTHSRDAVLAGTLATMAAYPDRRLYGDEVIWGGDDVTGFYSSHRLTHAGTNTGWSLYGPPTGKRVTYRAVADCFVRENTIVEEWLTRDELSLVHQLGLDPVKTAKEMARKEADSGLTYPAAADVERGVGQLPPEPAPKAPSGEFSPEHFIRSMIHEMWNWRLLNKVREYYAETIAAESASMRKMNSRNEYQSYMLSLLSPFPNLAMTVEHFCMVGDAEIGYRTATRWRMRGTHTGFGIYGEPTGNPINIMGMSHHLIQDGKIQREWTIFDEFALLKQIHRPQ